MLPTNTPSPTEAPLNFAELTVAEPTLISALPHGCRTEGSRLILPEGLQYDQWMSVGRRLADTTRAAMWALGDWLAWGEEKYAASHWGGRTPSELYARLAEETGYAESTLANAKKVCLRLPPLLRRDNVTFGHAQEIVGRVRDSDDYEGWVDYVSQGGVSVKALRDRIRKSNAQATPEAHDAGTPSFLETARQFARDFSAARETFTPGHVAELRKILGDVVRGLL